MRPWLVPPVVVLMLALPTGAAAQTGGTAAPDEGGGAEYGRPDLKPRKPAAKKRKRRARPLIASEFGVNPGTLQPGGAPAEFAFRIDGSPRRARVRIDLVRVGERSPTVRLRMGWKRTGVRYTRTWGPQADELPQGDYVARLHAVDDRGRVLTRTATASGRSPLQVASAPVKVGNGVFPIQGAWSWGGEDARFGAPRGTRSHQGQDLVAAEGTPLVSPRAGSVLVVGYQPDGAGHYVVIRADEGRDLVFMHLVKGSIPVAKNDPVQPGQQIGQVGNSGRSFGAHLHFEIWPDGWYAKGAQPIDPRPDLEAWAAL